MSSTQEKANGGKKRKKGYYKNFQKKQKGGNIQPDMKGFLVTFEKKEYDAARDCFNILNEYAEKIWGPEGDVKEEGDIEDQLGEELEVLRNAEKKDRRFQKLRTDVAGNFFMRTTVEDPALLVTTILEDLKKTQQQKSRFILRLLPILSTCRAHLDSVKKTLETVLSDYSAGPEETRYLVVCRVRHNSEMKNAALTTEMVEVVERVKPRWVPDLKNPELVVMIDVLQGISCVSLLKDYYDYKKYNLFELTKPSVKAEDEKGIEEGEAAEAGGDAEAPPSKKIKTEDNESNPGNSGDDSGKNDATTTD